MFKDVPYSEYAPLVNEKLSGSGVFLTTQAEKLNAMTIGWGFIGRMWGGPIFIVPVRTSRFTHELIEKSGEFTVSVSFEGMSKELALCGSKSGRNIDKFKEANLTAIPGKVVGTPVIGECSLHFECKVVYKQDMDPKQLDAEYNSKCYANGDYHTLYYGQIVACYEKREVVINDPI